MDGWGKCGLVDAETEGYMVAVGRLDKGVGKWMDEEFGHTYPQNKQTRFPVPSLGIIYLQPPALHLPACLVPHPFS